MRKSFIFILTVFSVSSLLAVEGAYISRPIVREYDLVPSSRPAIIQFPNGSVTMSGSTASINLPTFTDLSNATSSITGLSATIDFSSVASREFVTKATSAITLSGGSLVLPLPEGATNYLTNYSTGIWYYENKSTMTFSSATFLNGFNVSIDSFMLMPFSINTTTSSMVYVKLSTFIDNSPQIMLNGATSVGSTISYSYPLQIGDGNDKTSNSAPTQVQGMFEKMGICSVSVRDATDNVEIQMKASSSNGVLGTLTNNGLTFRTNDADKMILDTSGELSVTDTTNGKIVIGATASSNDPAFMVRTGSASIQSTTSGNPTGLQVGGTNFIVLKGGAGVAIGTTTGKGGALTIQGNANFPILFVGSSLSVNASLFEVGFTSSQIKNNVYIDSLTTYGSITSTTGFFGNGAGLTGISASASSYPPFDNFISTAQLGFDQFSRSTQNFSNFLTTGQAKIDNLITATGTLQTNINNVYTNILATNTALVGFINSTFSAVTSTGISLSQLWTSVNSTFSVLTTTGISLSNLWTSANSTFSVLTTTGISLSNLWTSANSTFSVLTTTGISLNNLWTSVNSTYTSLIGVIGSTYNALVTTSTRLSTVGTINTADNPVDWSQLKNVPAGFADGVDNTGGGTSSLVLPLPEGATNYWTNVSSGNLLNVANSTMTIYNITGTSATLYSLAVGTLNIVAGNQITFPRGISCSNNINMNNSDVYGVNNFRGNSNLSFQTGDNVSIVKMRVVNTSGFVGISTAIPSAMLHVCSTSSYQDSINPIVRFSSSTGVIFEAMSSSISMNVGTTISSATVKGTLTAMGGVSISTLTLMDGTTIFSSPFQTIASSQTTASVSSLTATITNNFDNLRMIVDSSGTTTASKIMLQFNNDGTKNYAYNFIVSSGGAIFAISSTNALGILLTQISTTTGMSATIDVFDNADPDIKDFLVRVVYGGGTNAGSLPTFIEGGGYYYNRNPITSAMMTMQTVSTPANGFKAGSAIRIEGKN